MVQQLGAALLICGVAQAGLTAATTNSWTKPTSGNWEEPYWSLGLLPSMAQDAIEFRNPGWKALAIAPSTTANYPGSLAIQNLTVDAPADSSNLLLLNYAGLNVPLYVAGDLIVGPNGSLLSYYSRLHAQTFSLNGPTTFAEQSAASFDTIKLGELAPAELMISNTTFSAGSLTLGGTNGISTAVSVANSTVTISDIHMLAPSTFKLAGGLLDTTNLEVGALPAPGTVDFRMYDGTMRVRALLRIGQSSQFTPRIEGNFLLSGGRMEVEEADLNTGRFTQTGGTNLTEVLNAPRTDGTDHTEYFLMGGFLGSGQVELGNFSFYGNGGTFVQSNGVHANSEYIRLWAVDRTGAHNVRGRYTLAGGLFTSPQINVMGGAFSQSGGTNQTTSLEITDDGSYYIEGGFLTASNISVNSRDTRGFYSSYYHQGGTTIVPGSFSLLAAASFTIQTGTFSATNIVVGTGETQFAARSRPIFSMPGNGAIVNRHFTLAGGNVSARFQHQLGKMALAAGSSVLGFDEGGAVVRFLDSHSESWPGTLRIINWAGSTNGGAGTRLFFGTTAQGLTAAQLNRIYFYAPAGLPTGNYPARILATGEVVPVAAGPTITYTRSTNQLVLSWPTGFQLYTATNVTGPYTPVPNAESPYAVNFTDPQRYFQLRATPN